MNIFQDNLKRLASRDQDLAAAVKSAAGGVLTIEPARSGVPSARRSGRWIHSAYDPLREAQTWADTHVPACQSGETVVVAGVGLLYHVEALRQRLSPDVSVAVLIPGDFHLEEMPARDLAHGFEQVAHADALSREDVTLAAFALLRGGDQAVGEVEGRLTAELDDGAVNKACRPS